MLSYMKKFERLVIFLLMVLMALVVFLSVIELAWIVLKDIVSPPFILLKIDQLLEIFGLFLLVLIGIELLDTIKAYIQENVVHAEVVLMVAIIAISRKVIILDIKKIASATLMGIGVVIIALSIGYYLVKRCYHEERP
ncbi:MAG: phosphate-starvation-inducible PsiE family protein [bacterium]